MTAYQLLRAVKLSWNLFTSEIEWEIVNIRVSQKSVWLVEFKIPYYFDSLSVGMSYKAVIKKITSEIDWGIANPIECQKSVQLVEFKILAYFNSLSAVVSC